MSERHHHTSIYKLIAFGGHDVRNTNGEAVVTRRRLRRLGVSDVLSFHTAALLQRTSKLFLNR